MPIRINRKHRGKKFSAWDDLVGKAVKCPKCQQEMMVPGGDAEMPGAATPQAPASLADPMSDEADGIGLSSPPSSSGASPTLGNEDLVEPMASASYEPLPSAANEDAFELPMPSVGTPKPVAKPKPSATPRPSAPSSTEIEDDLDDADDLPFACPSCNQTMPPQEDLCDNCGYHRVLRRRIDISHGINKPDKTTGFERVLRRQLENSETAEAMLMYLKIAGLVAILLLLIVLVFCGGVGWVLAVIAVAIVGYLVYRTLRGNRIVTGDSAVNRDILSSTVWGTLLNIQRLIGWRTMAWPFPTTKALTLHDSTFTDADLAELQELVEYQTLDLEGTQISNEGLQHLQSMTQLHYIVLLQTNVSVGGVQKLQQAIPAAWIWF